MVMTSPASTRASRRDRWVFASWMLTTRSMWSTID
jgi:hypothetical protein